MKAVMYGGGNIGRGFIGQLLSESGYEVTFVDVVDAVVDGLNKNHCYPVRILEGDSHRDVTVKNVSAVDGKDPSAVAEAIAGADVMATAVGVNVLKFIVPNIAAGLRLRMQRAGAPLNIIICENLMDANKVVEGMLKAELSADEQAWMDKNVGLVEASIGRMVPVQTDEMKDGEPLRVCVESYGCLPVDKDAFKGGIPDIKGMLPASPFDFYIKRKLYVHNMGHATCAYLGDLLNIEYIYESIDRDDVCLIVRRAMEESAMALSRRYGVALEDIMLHINDLLIRFTNAALRDTCKRVGGDPARKLGANDRLIGAASLALETGVPPVYVAIGAAAGLHRYLAEADGMTQCEADAGRVLETVSGLSPDGELYRLIMDAYRLIVAGATLKELRLAADKAYSERIKGII